MKVKTNGVQQRKLYVAPQSMVCECETIQMMASSAGVESNIINWKRKADMEGTATEKSAREWGNLW